MRAAGADNRRCGSHASTLVEVLIVVVILGILAAIVIPQFADATDGAGKTAFASEITAYARAAQLFEAETGEYLADGSTGAVPAGFEDYIDEAGWSDGSPIGGRWDTEFNDNGVTSALGLVVDAGDDIDDAYMTEVDAMIDNGDLDSGGFQKIADGRYYMILAP